VKCTGNVLRFYCYHSEDAKILVFVNIASSYVKFRFQQPWLWRILSSVTAWPLKIALTVRPESPATDYQPTSRNIWVERRPQAWVLSRSRSMPI